MKHGIYRHNNDNYDDNNDRNITEHTNYLVDPRSYEKSDFICEIRHSAHSG